MVPLTCANSLVIVIRGKNVKNSNILEISGDSGIKKKKRTTDTLRVGKEALEVLKNYKVKTCTSKYETKLLYIK